MFYYVYSKWLSTWLMDSNIPEEFSVNINLQFCLVYQHHAASRHPLYHPHWQGILWSSYTLQSGKLLSSFPSGDLMIKMSHVERFGTLNNIRRNVVDFCVYYHMNPSVTLSRMTNWEFSAMAAIDSPSPVGTKAQHAKCFARFFIRVLMTKMKL